MGLASLLPLVMLLAADPSAAAPATATPPLPAPIYTRQTLFAIPFRIDRPDRISREPEKVQLFVSGDRGAHWDRYIEVEPQRQQFLFRAGNDGELWFDVRTRDRAGQLRPAGPHAAGLRVVVDTTPPKLQLDVRRGEGGQVVLRWQIDEPYPKPGSLTVQYRTGPTAPWQAVALAKQEASPAGSVQTGEIAWWPPTGATRLEIRGEVSDRAGNPAVSHAQVNLEFRPAMQPDQKPGAVNVLR